MPRLIGRTSSDRGAAVVVVALLLSSGLIMGLMALVVDLGMIRVERLELQRASTASAFSAAYDCSFAPTTSTSANCGKSQYASDLTAVSPFSLSGRNSSDGIGAVSQICGKDVNGILAACPPVDATAKDCYRIPVDKNKHYVQVTVTTQTASGNKVPAVFAKVIPGYSGSTGTACAQAAWAAPDSIALTLAFALSKTCWEQQIQNAATKVGYAPPPPYDDPGEPLKSIAPKYERTILYLEATNTNNAPSAACKPTATAPSGGFGWLKSPSGASCTAVVTYDGYAEKDSGLSAAGCGKAFTDAYHQMITVPVYDTVDSIRGYHIVGFAPFFLSGWKVVGLTVPGYGNISDRPPYATQQCQGNDKCMYGWFTQSTLLTNQSTPIDPDRESFGLNVVKLVG